MAKSKLTPAIDRPALTALLKTRADAPALVSTWTDGTLAIWDLDRRRHVVKTTTGHAKSRSGVFGVRAAAFAPLAASWADDRTIRLWSTRNGTPLGILAVAPTYLVYDVAFHPHEPLVAAAIDYAIHVWDLRDGSERMALPPRETRAGVVPRDTVGFHPDGKNLVVVTGDGELEVFALATAKRIESARLVPASANAWAVGRLQWGQDGTLAVCSEDTIVLRRGKSRPRSLAFDAVVVDFAWSGDSLLVIAGNAIGEVSLEGKRSWWTEVKRADGQPTRVVSMNETIVEGTSKGAIRLRTPSTGAIVATLAGHAKQVTGLAVGTR